MFVSETNQLVLALDFCLFRTKKKAAHRANRSEEQQNTE